MTWHWWAMRHTVIMIVSRSPIRQLHFYCFFCEEERKVNTHYPWWWFPIISVFVRFKRNLLVLYFARNCFFCVLFSEKLVKLHLYIMLKKKKSEQCSPSGLLNENWENNLLPLWYLKWNGENHVLFRSVKQKWENNFVFRSIKQNLGKQFSLLVC